MVYNVYLGRRKKLANIVLCSVMGRKIGFDPRDLLRISKYPNSINHVTTNSEV